MHLGVLLTHLGRRADPAADPHADLEVVRLTARSADVLGYHSVWAVDPALAPVRPDGAEPAGFDPVEALHDAARCTDRVQLWLHAASGDGVAAAPSRLRDFPAPHRLSVALDVTTATDPASLEASARAMPVGRPPSSVLVSGADADATARFAARLDGWLATHRTLAVVERTWAQVVATAAQAGRDPDDLMLVVRADIELTGRPLSRHRSTFCGSLEQVVDDLLDVGRLGAHTAVLAFSDPLGVDDVLGGYAAIAEGLELRTTP